MDKQTITKDFTVVHATVTFPDSDEQRAEYVERWDESGIIKLRDISSDAWYARYSDYHDEPKLEYNLPPDETITFSVHNIESIEGRRVDKLTAVAEVEVEEVSRTRRLLRSDDVEYDVTLIDVTIWERVEWEAAQNG